MVSAASDAGGPAARRIELGVGLVGIGAVLLFVSLFLHWYEPGRSAWTVFEVWDLVLAGLAGAALVAVAGRLRLARTRPDRWLIAPSVAAFVIVVASLLNHPPAAIGAGPMIGIWLALGASVLMLAGVALSVAQVSVAIKIVDPAGGEAPRARAKRQFRRPGGAVPAARDAQSGGQTEETRAFHEREPPGSAR